jgi:hypothetical protein
LKVRFYWTGKDPQDFGQWYHAVSQLVDEPNDFPLAIMINGDEKYIEAVGTYDAKDNKWIFVQGAP